MSHLKECVVTLPKPSINLSCRMLWICTHQLWVLSTERKALTMGSVHSPQHSDLALRLQLPVTRQGEEWGAVTGYIRGLKLCLKQCCLPPTAHHSPISAAKVNHLPFPTLQLSEHSLSLHCSCWHIWKAVSSKCRENKWQSPHKQGNPSSTKHQYHYSTNSFPHQHRIFTGIHDSSSLVPRPFPTGGGNGLGTRLDSSGPWVYSLVPRLRGRPGYEVSWCSALSSINWHGTWIGYILSFLARKLWTRSDRIKNFWQVVLNSQRSATTLPTALTV